MWFKRDLRVDDHRPLAEAAARGAVLPLYIVEPSIMAAPDYDRSHWEFVRQSLVELRERTAALGSPLVVRVGEAVEVLEDLRRETGATVLLAHEETGNALTYARDLAVHRWARANRVLFRECPSGGVVRRLTDRDGWARNWERRMRQPLTPAPSALLGHRLDPGPIPEWDDLPLPRASWPEGRQPGGEAAAAETLESWLAGRGDRYPKELSSPVTAFSACSRLSPHLAWGTMSPRRAFRTVEAAGDFPEASRRAFLSRMRWREHFVQKLESEPEIEFHNFVRAFDGMRGEPDPVRLAAWREGMTGYPMVDACLRCAAATGYLNFRMRAMVAAFSGYHLWLPWREPALISARWWLDYEPGIHYSQFQMQNGTTGINTVRIYNPVKQGLDHDPTGAFTRHWVPELRDVPDAFLHQPWLASQRPAAYPERIVHGEEAMARARAELARWRALPEARAEADAVQRRHGSRRGSRPSFRPPVQSPQIAMDLD